MPLNIKVDNPAFYAGAALPVVPSFEDVINGITGLIGLWEPSALTDGAVVNLAPTYGATTLTRNAVGVNKSTVGGKAAVTFDVANTRLAATWTAGGAPVSALMNFYVRENTADFQNFFGNAGTPRLLYRSTQTVQWSATGTISNMALTPPVIGWHRAEIYISASTARVVIDGTEYSVAQAGNNATTLYFGNNANATANTSIALGKMFACNSDIYGTPAADAIKAYLAI